MSVDRMVRDPVAGSAGRVILIARRLVHGQRDEQNVPVTIETLVAVVTAHERNLAAAERAEGVAPNEG